MHFYCKFLFYKIFIAISKIKLFKSLYLDHELNELELMHMYIDVKYIYCINELYVYIIHDYWVKSIVIFMVYLIKGFSYSKSYANFYFFASGKMKPYIRIFPLYLA